MHRTIPFAFLLVVTGCGLSLGDAELVDTRSDTVDAGGLDALLLDVGDGALDVRGVPGLDAVEVEVELYSRGAADDAIDRMEYEFRVERGAARLRVQIREAPRSLAQVHADVFVRVPARFAVRGLDGDGPAFLGGVRELAFEDGDGTLEVEAVEALELLDGDGDLVLRDVGAAIVEDGDGELTLEGATSLEVVDGDGTLVLSAVAGDAFIVDGNGELTLVGVGGDAEVQDGDGSMLIDGVAGTLTIRDGDGDITLGEVGRLVLVETGDGQVGPL